MARAPRSAHALLSAPLLLWAACIDASIQKSPDASNAGANGNGNGNGEECTLADQTLEPTTFDSEVLPGLVASCNASGCHAPETAGGGFAVHGGAYQSADAAEHCDFVDSIESFAEFADRESPSDSRMLQALDGRIEHFAGTWDPDQAPRPAIEAYLEAIAGGGDDAPGLAAFETDIQPILDETGGTGCATGSACHESGAGEFTLTPEPAPGSAEMRANYDQAVAKSSPADPGGSVLVQRAETTHFGSPVVSDAERQTLVDWIGTLSE